MKKHVFARALLAASVASALASSALAAPVVVVPGSNAGYLYFPSSANGGGHLSQETGSSNSVSIDGMQLASTACLTSSGTVTLPPGFVSGYIQAILVSGGEGETAGGTTSITFTDIGTVSATGIGSGGGGSGSAKGANLGGGGGGGGYLGTGGAGGDSGPTGSPLAGGGGGTSGGNGGTVAGGTAPGAGQGSGYGTGTGKGGGNIPTGQTSPTTYAGDGAVGLAMTAPTLIQCSNVPEGGLPSSAWGGVGKPGSGFGAGGAGFGTPNNGTFAPERGGNSGAIKTVTFKYTSGAMTVVVGTGGSGGSKRGAGAPGVVALRFIPL